MRGNVSEKLLEAVKSIEAVLSRCNEYLIGVTFIAMFVIGTFAVFMRYICHLPLTWADEVNSLLLVWLTFLGASIATRQNTHMNLNLKLLDLFPRSIGLCLRMLFDLLIIALLGVFIVQGIRMTIASRLVTLISLPIISMVFLYAILPATALLMLFYFVLQKCSQRPKEGQEK